MYKKILVPLDGSEYSLQALDAAKEIGERFQSEIHILTVLNESSYYFADSDKFKQAAVESAKNALKEGIDRIAGYEYGVIESYLGGKVSEIIVDYAEENDIGLIVMGNRGLGAFSRTFLGSVSHKVLNATHKSVLIVKD